MKLTGLQIHPAKCGQFGRLCTLIFLINIHKKANETGSKYLRKAFLNIRDRVYQELRHIRNSYYSGRIDEHKNDPKQTWKILKQALGRGNKSAVIEQIIFND